MNRKMRAKLANQTARRTRQRREATNTAPTCQECGEPMVLVPALVALPMRPPREKLH